MNPVYCVGCRTHIPRAVSNAGRGLCPACVAKLAAPSVPLVQPAPPVSVPPPAGPSSFAGSVPGAVPPHWPPSSPTPQYAAVPRQPLSLTTVAWIGGAVVTVALVAIGTAVVNGIQADKERQKYVGILARLKKAHPDKSFALAVRPSETVRMDAQLAVLKVDSVELDRSSTSVRADVAFTSTSPAAVKPLVYVSLWDAKGAMLGRSKVVAHSFADLEAGRSDHTEDSFPVQSGSEPVAIAVDDGVEERRQEEVSQAEADRLTAAATAQAQAAGAEAARKTASERAALAAEERVRGPKPVPSAWDEITPEANAYLKATLKDYDSMKLVECSPVAAYGSDAWAQRVKYRARNSFGGYVLEEQAFVIRNRRVIDVLEY